MMVLGCTGAACLVAGIGLWHDSEYLLLPGPVMAICLPVLPLIGIPLFGMPKTRWWAICWYWVLSLAILLVFSIAVLVCLADFLGLTPGGARDTWHIYFWLILLATTAPGTWFLLKLVRDPWWQPWRPPR